MFYLKVYHTIYFLEPADGDFWDDFDKSGEKTATIENEEDDQDQEEEEEVLQSVKSFADTEKR
jgi:hypothetical protein